MLIDIIITALSVAGTFVQASPRIRVRRGLPLERFSLPDNATAIRENIDTSFSCQSRSYGYYADLDNDCQLFHVCLPVVWDTDGTQQTFMWSFICPQETIFNQERFTCARPEDAVPCQEAAMFYSLNERFGERPSLNEPTEPSEFESTVTIIEAR
ncbi:uncharacterized protein [Halyomorpha halys]|uniref:uncharacterized protein n=1 Tax=Halyomorpha halys TaxID=286706 RepID=UPI0006D52676|nr:uncharacterized protein LOC106678054 [Halyomorpha halys]